MSTRGPKENTVKNSPRNAKRLIRRDSLESPSELNPAAEIEYRRILAVLDSMGTLDRFDLAQIAQAARVKEQLDRVNQEATKNLDFQTMRIQHMLSAQWRGYMRDLGMTVHPGQVRVRVNAKNHPSNEDSPVARYLKLSS